MCDKVYQNDTTTFDEEMYLEYLEDVVSLIYVNTGVESMAQSAQPFFYEIAMDHKTPKVKRWLKRNKCDRFEIHASFTWKWQLVDVALAVNGFAKSCIVQISLFLFVRCNIKTIYIPNGATVC